MSAFTTLLLNRELELAEKDLESAALFGRQWRDAVKKAHEDLFRTMFRRALRMDLKEGRKTGSVLIDTLVESMPECVNHEPRSGRPMNKLQYCFVTVNFKDGIDVRKAFKQMERCVSKALLASETYAWVLEQRSEGDQEEYGWHIHWLVRFSEQRTKSVVVQQVYQSFRMFLVGSNYVDVKDVAHTWDVHLSYIRGEKKEEKMAKVLRDRELREKYFLPHIVEHGSLLSASLSSSDVQA